MKALMKLIPAFLTLALLLALAAVPLSAAEPDYKYREISTEEELLKLSDDDHYDGNFILTQDITLTKEHSISPIEFFDGTLNGNGHKIIGYKGAAPLFDVLGAAALIKNLTFEDAVVSGGSKVAMLVNTNKGTLWNLTFRNISVTGTGTDVAGVCYDNQASGRIEHIDFEGTVTGNGDRAAGIVIHQRKDATLRYCTVRGKIESNFHVGGIASHLMGGAVMESCLNFATVLARKSRAGGICATNVENSKIINCGNYGEIRAWREGDPNNSGALVAGIGANEKTGFEFRNCFNAGKLITKNTSTAIGGICSYFNVTGDDIAKAFVNCYTVAGLLNRYTDDTATTTQPIGDTDLAAKATSGTVVPAEEWGTQAMVDKLGAGFVLTGDTNAPIGLAADTTPEPQPKVPEPEPTDEPTDEPTKEQETPIGAPTGESTQKPTDKPTGETEKETTGTSAANNAGCSSALGLGSIALIAAAGVAAGALRKKKED